MSVLTPKQRRFVEEYLIDLNATQAAIRAGYSARTARQIGEENLSKPDIASAIQTSMHERAKRTKVTADRVVEELWAIATADPNELVQFRRGSCSDCWGAGEPDDEREEQAHGGALKRMRKAHPISDEEPNPECATCGGEGVGHAWIADTRKLKGAVRKLYAGVKVTKDGLEVKMHDKVNCLIQVGRHLGMFTDKVEVNASLTERFKAARERVK